MTAKMFGPPAVPVTRFVRADALMREPAPDAIVQDAAWAGCVSVLVSAPGSGKTFVLLSQAAAISRARPWLGRRVRHGSVAYVSFEGDALGVRLRAIVEDTGDALDHLYVLRATDPISPQVTREGGEMPSAGELAVGNDLVALAADLAAAGLPPIVLLVIDTVRASLTGSEDSSEHVSAYLRGVRRLLARVPGAGAILAHHAGWLDGETQKKRERGSSAWRGNVDGTLFLDVDDDSDRAAVRLKLSTLKARDSDKAAPLSLVRRRVELAERDHDGRPVYSCVITEDRRSYAEREADSQATEAKAARDLDLRVLRLVSENPLVARSQDALRMALNVARPVVQTAVGRLLHRGWLLPPERQRQPYTLTEAGQTALLTERNS